MKKETPDHDLMMKILLIGNSGVGKSCMLMQYSQKKFIPSFYNTIGVDFKIKHLVLNDKKIKMQIWDTAGQDRFKTITSSYYRGAHGIIIVYDITDRNSYQSVQSWLTEIDKYADQKIKKVLVGNKCDLGQRRQVTLQQGQKYAKSLGIYFFETSARDCTNIDTLFTNLAKYILGNTPAQKTTLEKQKPDQGVKKLISDRKAKQQTSNCC